VEYGKLRLIQILFYIHQNVAPGQFRLLYSNIDNIIYALGNADSLEEAILNEKRVDFENTKHLYFYSSDINSKSPGLAELKWIRKGRESRWKFITIRTQHYCLVVSSDNNEENNLHKTSGWSSMSTCRAYEAAKALLDGQVVDIVQTRRINKKSNMNTREIQFLYQI
jgi:hypothetical protein